VIDILAIIGLHWIIKYGSILNWPRNLIKKIPMFSELLKCSLCLGVWCGVGVAVYIDKDPFVYACVGSAVCWIADNIVTVLQRVDIKLEKE